MASPERPRPRSASPETATANKTRKQDKLAHFDDELAQCRGRLNYPENQFTLHLRPVPVGGGAMKQADYEFNHPCSVGSNESSEESSDVYGSSENSYRMATRLPSNTVIDDKEDSTRKLSVTDSARASKRKTKKLTVFQKKSSGKNSKPGFIQAKLSSHRNKRKKQHSVSWLEVNSSLNSARRLAPSGGKENTVNARQPTRTETTDCLQPKAT